MPVSGKRILRLAAENSVANQVGVDIANIVGTELPVLDVLIATDWDFFHPGFDAVLASPNLYALAAEWGVRFGADLIVFSSPDRRILTQFATDPGQCFQVLGELGRMGLLYRLGNKLFSRELVSRLHMNTAGSRFLPEALMKVESILVFSYPWVDFSKPGMEPDGNDFFSLAERFSCLQGQRYGH